MVVLIYSGTPLFQTPLGKYKCPDYRGVLISGASLYHKAQFVSVLNTGVLNRGVLLWLQFSYMCTRNECFSLDTSQLYVYMYMYIHV